MSLTDIWERKTPLISEESGWDPNRDTGNISMSSSVKTALDPLAYLVGSVRVVYGSDASKTQVVDLSKYIDREKKVVRSITGELETDYGRGVYRVNAPKAQGVAGFLSDAGPQRLNDVEITCHNAYATIVFVPLDGKPIRESSQLLLQAGTTCRPTGWVARATQLTIGGHPQDAFQILNPGKLPWQVENVTASVTVTNPNLKTAILLDVNGMATKSPVTTTQADGKFTVELPPNCMYLVLTDRER